MINTLPKSLIEAAKKILTESIHPMIDVDGEMKHRHNSNGVPIHHTDEGIKNFHRWFGDSKVIDEHGRPKVFYHGTTRVQKASKGHDVPITSFKSDANTYWFSENPSVSNFHAGMMNDYKGGNTIPVYIKTKSSFDATKLPTGVVKNPHGTFLSELHSQSPSKNQDAIRFFEKSNDLSSDYKSPNHEGRLSKYWDTKQHATNYKKLGFDSIKSHMHVDGYYDSPTIGVFDKSQIKSAIGNNGDFHPKKPQINESVESQIHTTNSLGMPIHKTVEGVHNFNKWFDGSKVKDDHGRPLVVYHGTNAHVYSGDEEIDNFHTNPESGRGAAFFTSNKSLAHEYGQKVYHTYLKLKNPLIIDAQGKHWSAISHNSPIKGEATDKLNAIRKQRHNDVESVARDMSEVFGDPYTPKEFHPMNSLEGHSLKHIPGLEHDDIETDQVVKAAKKNGFDGVIFHNVKDSPTNDQGYRHDTADVYAVFHPQHIKSTDNNGQFGTEWHQGIKE